MELKKDLKFTGQWFKGDCVIDLVDEEINDLEVLITSEDGHTRREHWNLQNTIWGFENGDYIETKPQTCCKTNEPCNIMSDYKEKAKKLFPANSWNGQFNLEQEKKQTAYIQGYEECKKEYEEKLRWIAIEEKDAPNEIIQMKLENGEVKFGYFTDRIKTTSNVKGFDFIKVTHYRTLSFYNAT